MNFSAYFCYYCEDFVNGMGLELVAKGGHI